AAGYEACRRLSGRGSRGGAARHAPTRARSGPAPARPRPRRRRRSRSARAALSRRASRATPRGARSRADMRLRGRPTERRTYRTLLLSLLGITRPRCGVGDGSSLLAFGSTLPPAFPPEGQWHAWEELSDYSGATAPASHRLPRTIASSAPSLQVAARACGKAVDLSPVGSGRPRAGRRR